MSSARIVGLLQAAAKKVEAIIGYLANPVENDNPPDGLHPGALRYTKPLAHSQDIYDAESLPPQRGELADGMSGDFMRLR